MTSTRRRAALWTLKLREGTKFVLVLGLASFGCAKAGIQNVPAGGRPAEEFFVATNGNDVWSGRLATPNAHKTDGPFATLPRALSAVRALTGQPRSSTSQSRPASEQRLPQHCRVA